MNIAILYMMKLILITTNENLFHFTIFDIDHFLVSLFYIFAPDGRRPGRAAKDQTLAIRIARNGPCMRSWLSPTGAKPIWVRRAAQRAEPGAP